MKSKTLLVFLLPLTVAFCQKVMAQASVQPASLRTEYLNNPIGVIYLNADALLHTANSSGCFATLG